MSIDEVTRNGRRHGSGVRGSSRRRWLRRTVRVLVVVLLLLVPAFFLGGGWYFSGQVNASALEVGPATEHPRSAFANPRAALGRPARAVTYPTELGRQPSWFVPGRGSTWAILVHGKGEDRSEMLRMMRSTVAAGLPSMDITYRNDVGGPQDASGRYQYGRSEWRDLAAAVDYALAHGARHVVLVGASMGGGIVASYLRHTDRPGPRDSPVAALVLDSPMLDLGETVDYGAAQRPLPVFGHVPGALTWTAKRITTLRYGVDWAAVDYADDSAWVDVPTLVFHGTGDRTVPITGSRRVAAAHPGLVHLVAVRGAGHVASWNAGPSAYDARLIRFLRGR